LIRWSSLWLTVMASSHTRDECGRGEVGPPSSMLVRERMRNATPCLRGVESREVGEEQEIGQGVESGGPPISYASSIGGEERQEGVGERVPLIPAHVLTHGHAGDTEDLLEGGGLPLTRARGWLIQHEVERDVKRRVYLSRYREGIPRRVLLGTRDAELWNRGPRIETVRCVTIEAVRDALSREEPREREA
jgi:hypothetical protein